MKYYIALLSIILVMLGGCNHNEEPPTEVALGISQQFLPVTKEFSKNYSEFAEQAKEFDEINLIVNSVEELPDDPLGFSNAYRKIDYDNYTLFLAYRIYRWNYEAYTNWFYRNRLENCYYWQMHLRGINVPDPDSDIRTFNRFAIVVRKLPADANIKFETVIGSIGSSGWWEDDGYEE